MKKTMSWFKKESTIHYIRDSTGKVIGTSHSGDEERRENVFDRAARNRQANREVRQRERRERRYDRRIQQNAEREAQRKAYNEERLKVRAERGRQAAHHPVTAMLPHRRIVHVHTGNDHKYYYKRNGKYYYKNNERKQNYIPEKKHRMTPSEFQKRMMKGF
jgi:hypothetical protein